MMFNGFSELPIMITRLPVFYKQRDNYFHPAWAWSISSWILRVPYSVIEAVVWSCVVYYSVGFAPSAGRCGLATDIDDVLAPHIITSFPFNLSDSSVLCSFYSLYIKWHWGYSD